MRMGVRGRALKSVVRACVRARRCAGLDACARCALVHALVFALVFALVRALVSGCARGYASGALGCACRCAHGCARGHARGYGCVCRLRELRRGGEAGADGPDRLVRNNDVLELRLGDTCHTKGRKDWDWGGGGMRERACFYARARAHGRVFVCLCVRACKCGRVCARARVYVSVCEREKDLRGVSVKYVCAQVLVCACMRSFMCARMCRSEEMRACGRPSGPRRRRGRMRHGVKPAGNAPARPLVSCVSQTCVHVINAAAAEQRQRAVLRFCATVKMLADLLNGFGGERQNQNGRRYFEGNGERVVVGNLLNLGWTVGACIT
eukprot:5587807-Pleurochrysis_carterae.AAC.3